MDGDISNILNSSGSSSGLGLPDFNAIMQSLMPFIILFTILTLVLTILYGISLVERLRANHAIIEIRDMLKEMKQSQSAPAAPPSAPSENTPPKEKVLAAEEPVTKTAS